MVSAAESGPRGNRCFGSGNLEVTEGDLGFRREAEGQEVGRGGVRDVRDETAERMSWRSATEREDVETSTRHWKVLCRALPIYCISVHLRH